jgi:predicted ATPase
MFIQRLRLKKVLSFNDAEIELGPLNVLIGPNAVGKSNLIEVMGLLQAAPTSLLGAVLRGGGVRQWLWLGGPVPSPIGSIECGLVLTEGHHAGPLVYELDFSEDSGGFVILKEHLSRRSPAQRSYFERAERRVVFSTTAGELMTVGHAADAFKPANVPRGESVLAFSKSPVDATPITEVGIYFADIKILREFRTGPGSPIRSGVTTTAPGDAIMDGAENLPLVLQHLHVRNRHDRIRDYLHRFCERFEDVKVDVGGGLARIMLQERGLAELLSAIRMSDGTLKFLSILAALFDPAPPPLLCMEEPELGLHPDALPLIAEALVEASQSVQLIVTTHSEALVDALSDTPESVLVCERDFDNGTQMKRLSKDQLGEWLAEYSLGELWRRGEIGGGLR